MFSKLIETVTGKDDVERVAYKDNPQLLADYLKTRRLFFPKRPRSFLDAATFTESELLQLIEQESKELAGESVELWILDMDGKKRLPAFSSKKAMEAFSKKMSMSLDKVFSLGCIEVLLTDILKTVDVDIIDLNRFSKKSWEITVHKRRAG